MGEFVAQFIGDGILAYFGYPVANENDPERAVRAALQIVQSIDEMATLPAAGPLKVRIGLATGQVIVSDLFSGGADDKQTIFGSCPNLAARLQTVAGPNEVVIAERTHQRVRSLFSCERLGKIDVRGFGSAARSLAGDRRSKRSRGNARNLCIGTLCWSR